ncbi:unnamed protein product [Vitrella brassicaformis CCMP3155]|uniref:Uncharacterized protein n=3 Tax=Vitrella brassicaformis TaxID=1169539 RepID=A0A0G4FEU8_VITBC|nr:unnamed protein product [Vitrella brassicaformis CCMP3155]|eukprot:CEM11730.1 unnamed protein product [Vitrella brassicaformis CCMP3155]
MASSRRKLRLEDLKLRLPVPRHAIPPSVLARAPQNAADIILDPRDLDSFVVNAAVLAIKFPGELERRLDALGGEVCDEVFEACNKWAELQQKEREAALKAEAEALKAEMAAIKERADLSAETYLEAEVEGLKGQVAFLKVREERQVAFFERRCHPTTAPAATRPHPRGARTEDTSSSPPPAAPHAPPRTTSPPPQSHHMSHPSPHVPPAPVAPQQYPSPPPSHQMVHPPPHIAPGPFPPQRPTYPPPFSPPAALAYPLFAAHRSASASPPHPHQVAMVPMMTPPPRRLHEHPMVNLAMSASPFPAAGQPHGNHQGGGGPGQ